MDSQLKDCFSFTFFIDGAQFSRRHWRKIFRTFTLFPDCQFSLLPTLQLRTELTFLMTNKIFLHNVALLAF